jgi:chromate transporter
MPPPSFHEATATWARIGVLSFGGPAGQIATMHRILVQERKWITEEGFLHALSFCMLLPGPEAMQLATYVGWLLHGVRGGIVAGTLFVLPGLATLLLLSALHATLGTLPGAAGLLFGLKAAVVAVVLEALLRVGRRTLRSAWHVGLAAAAFLAIATLGAPFPLVVASAAVAGVLAHRLGGHRLDSAAAPERPADGGPASRAGSGLATWLVAWLVPLAAVAAVLGPRSAHALLGVFFSKAAVVTFGGAYAVLAYVAQQAVEVHGWLVPGEMLDGLGLAETTPGPLVLVLVFVGFLAGYREPAGLPALLGGTLGGCVAAWATFMPCFLWIFLAAPHVERLRRVAALSAALQAVTAAGVGVILSLATWFATHALFTDVRRASAGPFALDIPVPASLDPVALAIAAAAAVALLRFRVPLLAVLAACAAVGLVVRLVS